MHTPPEIPPDASNYPRRLPRLPVLFQSHRSFYFITFNTYKRQPLLANNSIHHAFILFCQRAAERGIAVGRYVIMPDHMHLFIALPPDGFKLHSWIVSLKIILGKTICAIGHEKPHWQEGFFDHLLRSGESYGEKWNYVRQNPVRAGLANTLEEWRYQGEIVSIMF